MLTFVAAIGLSLGGVVDDRFSCACEHHAAVWWSDGRIDEATGRDARNYPPHRVVDFERMVLDIHIGDMQTPRMEVVQTLTFRPIAEPVRTLPLDAHLLEIRSVECDAADVAFAHDGEVLTLTFTPALPVGGAYVVKTFYEVADPPQGLKWTPASGDWPDRAAQLHTQGQPETNSYWFPCHDFPHERLSTEMIVTVPEGFTVSANGRLAGQSRHVREQGLKAYERFHWVQEGAHPNYLVTLVVGKFDVVDVGNGSLPMPVYAPEGRGGDVERTYGRTAEMVALYERLFDEPYPWDRYAQLVVWNFDSGGMENTTATTMFDTAVINEEGALDHSLESLIAHELAHQWFGDQLTCRSWEHIWLNEGFATYLESLWWEEVEGEAGYLRDVQMNFDAVIEVDRATAPRTAAMVSKEYTEPWDVFDRAANPYPKGASILHMLRRKLGDAVFFESIATYVDRFKGESVETHDLRKVMEDVSGEALEGFFDQWCERPGVPQLDVEASWADGALTVSVQQVQNIDGDNPAYVFDLPVWIGDGTGWRRAVVSVAERETTAVFDVASDPAIVCVDPYLDVLADVTVTQPWRRWRAQLSNGPTLAAQVQAVRALGRDGEASSVQLLAATAAGDGASTVRVEAVEALAAMGEAAELAGLLNDPAHAVRAAAVEGLAAGDVDVAAAEAIERMAASDPSVRVRAAALRALGVMGREEALGVLAVALETESQHDSIRQAGVAAFGSLDMAEGLDIAIRYAQPGQNYRTRARAVGVIGALAHHAPSTAYFALEELVWDRERRTWEAAVREMVALGDVRGVEVLAELAESKRDSKDAAWVLGQREVLVEEVEGGADDR